MEWLNFHHLRYFWMVARKGGVRKAAEALHVSQPSISAQLRLLEESLGQQLFKRTGRSLVLTEAGHLVLSYADEIFSAGRELMSSIKDQTGKRPMRLNIGITDAVSKLITFEILRAAFRNIDAIHVICREASSDGSFISCRHTGSTLSSRMNRLRAVSRRRRSIIGSDAPGSRSARCRPWRKSCAVIFRSRCMARRRSCRPRTWGCAALSRDGSMPTAFVRASSANSKIGAHGSVRRRVAASPSSRRSSIARR
jgi:hypothetical protein